MIASVSPLSESVTRLAAIAEAVRVIERDAADVMIAGGVGARLHPTTHCFRGHHDLSHRNEDPAAACRPFDAGRDGLVNGEGSASFVLETRQHAEARGANILGRILSSASSQEALRDGQPLTGAAVKRVIADAMRRAGLEARDLSHVNAHGLGSPTADAWEARGIHEVFGEQTPVWAVKSYVGSMGAGSPLVELAGSLLALANKTLPPTLNYQTPDPACPVNVQRQARTPTKPYVVKVSTTDLGQCAAVVCKKWE